MAAVALYLPNSHCTTSLFNYSSRKPAEHLTTKRFRPLDIIFFFWGWEIDHLTLFSQSPTFFFFFLFNNNTHFVVQTAKTKKYFIFYAGVGDNLIQSHLVFTYSPYSFNIVGNPCNTIHLFFSFIFISIFYVGRHRIRYLFHIPSHLFHTSGPTNIAYLSWSQSRMERERERERERESSAGSRRIQKQRSKHCIDYTPPTWHVPLSLT